MPNCLGPPSLPGDGTPSFPVTFRPCGSVQTLPTSLQFRHSPPETSPKRNWKARRRRLWWPLELPPSERLLGSGWSYPGTVSRGDYSASSSFPDWSRASFPDWSEMSKALLFTIVSGLSHQSMWPRWPWG